MIHWHGIAQQGGGWPFLSDRGDSCFSPQPPSRRADEEESSSASTLGVRPPDTSLSLPTTPDKQTAWPRAFPLPTVEEKQWHQSCSVQTNVVPINVSGKAAPTRGGRGRGDGAELGPGKDAPNGMLGGGRAGRVPVSPPATWGQQRHARVRHSLPSLLPSAAPCVRSAPPAGLLFVPRCPASRFCCHLGSHRAPSVHPSKTSMAAAGGKHRALS